MTNWKWSPRKKRAVIGIILVVLGVVGLIFAGVTAMSLAGVRQQLSRPDMQFRMSFASASERAQFGSALQIAQTIEYGSGSVGLVLLIVGIVLLVTLPREASLASAVPVTAPTGARVFCPGCGVLLEPGDCFCGSCGASV